MLFQISHYLVEPLIVGRIPQPRRGHEVDVRKTETRQAFFFFLENENPPGGQLR